MQIIINETVITKISSTKFEDVSVWLLHRSRILHLLVIQCTTQLHLCRFKVSTELLKVGQWKIMLHHFVCHTEPTWSRMAHPMKWITNEIWLRSDKNRKRMNLSNISANSLLVIILTKENCQNWAKSKEHQSNMRDPQTNSASVLSEMWDPVGTALDTFLSHATMT